MTVNVDSQVSTTVKYNQRAKYLGQRTFSAKIIPCTPRHTETHTKRLLYLNH